MVSVTDLHGLHVALATPVGPAGDLDTDGLDRLVARVIAGGVHAVCPVGSTGEGPRLTRVQRGAVTAAVRARVPDEHPVIPATSALTVADAIAEIEEHAAAGADAVLLAPPSYYPMSAGEVGAYYESVAAATALPLVLYNIPSMTKVALPPQIVGALAGHPWVFGIKDSSRDFEYLQSVLYASAGQEFAVLTGSDTMLLASLAVGAVGAIAASANLVPRLGRAVYDAALAGDTDAARSAQRELFDVIQACRVGVTPAGWKAALSLAGVCDATTVPPAAPLDDSQLSALATRLKELHAL